LLTLRAKENTRRSTETWDKGVLGAPCRLCQDCLFAWNARALLSVKGCEDRAWDGAAKHLRPEEDFMSKKAYAVAVAALLGTAPMAFAAQPAHRAATQATQEEYIQPDQMRASKMIGSAVYDVQNRKIGKVQDLVLGRDGKIDLVVVDVGSFLGAGGKNVAVKPTDIKTDNNRLTLDINKEQLQQMPNYALKDRNTGSGTSASPVHGGRLGSGR
jgi:sporulation protein YlmC with PRC-barrel domain